jgi:hypothetical protein
MDDDLRRIELRAFLTQARSRLKPSDIGLPENGRRRVPGLRREEVAELAAVTPLWYRLFESGRDVRVSEKFVERLSSALRLVAHDEVTLYRLALPGLYRADRARREADDALLPSPASPIASDGESEISEAAIVFAKDRERFLNGERVRDSRTRSRIVRSWQRSRALGVDAERREVPFAAARDCELAERRDVSERLLRAASDVLDHLANRFIGSGYAVVLTDQSGCLLQLFGDTSVKRKLAKFHFEPGGDWSESAAGTNAIGTALADRRPLQLMAAEHFCGGWGGYTCTAAPIRDAETNEPVGVLDFTGDYRLVRRHLLGTVLESALAIEERLSELR